jgi:hypothetical protein
MRPQDYWGTEFPAPYYQGAGAVIALGILAFWSGRHYLRSVLRSVLRGRGEEDIPAPLGYRLALAGLVLSLGYMVAFSMAAGSRLIVALPLVGLSLTYHMVWARLRAENGMSFIGFPFSAGTIMQEPLGTAILRPQEIVTINALSWAYWPGWGEGCEVITGASLDALKISDSARIGQRPLLAAMSAAVIFALIAGAVLMLSGTYLRGFWNYNMLYRSWMIVTMRNLGQADYDGIVNPSHFSLPVTMPLVGGMVVVFVVATPSRGLPGCQHLGHAGVVVPDVHRLAGEDAGDPLWRAQALSEHRAGSDWDDPRRPLAQLHVACRHRCDALKARRNARRSGGG